MDGMFDHDILKELVKLNEQIAALPKAIVAAIVTDLIDQSPEAPAPVGCQHPEDKRAQLGDGEWECTVRGCGYRHVPEPVGVRA